VRSYVIHGVWLLALVGVIAAAAALGNGHPRLPAAATPGHTLYFAMDSRRCTMPHYRCETIYAIDANLLAGYHGDSSLLPGARVVADVPLGVEALGFAPSDGATPHLLYPRFGEIHPDGSLGDRIDLWSVNIDGSEQHLVRQNVVSRADVFGGRAALPRVPGSIPARAVIHGGAGAGSVRVTSPDGTLSAYLEMGADSSWLCVVPSKHDDPRFGEGCTGMDGIIGVPAWQP
jgi:hypothetical protein